MEVASAGLRVALSSPPLPHALLSNFAARARSVRPCFWQWYPGSLIRHCPLLVRRKKIKRWTRCPWEERKSGGEARDKEIGTGLCHVCNYSPSADTDRAGAGVTGFDRHTCHARREAAEGASCPPSIQAEPRPWPQGRYLSVSLDESSSDGPLHLSNK